jgi:hypothetical protein
MAAPVWNILDTPSYNIAEEVRDTGIYVERVLVVGIIKFLLPAL